jgi:hypothetical protein
MEQWFSEAKTVAALDAELYFLLKDDFYFGPDRYMEDRSNFTHSLSLPETSRAQPSMITTSELAGHEGELSNYYKQIVASAIRHKMPFNSIRHYFWVRFWLWNSEENVHITFPWYDSYSEVKRFLDALVSIESGLVDHDIEQGWEIEVHAHEDHVYIRQRDPDSEETYVCVRVPRSGLILQSQKIMDRSTKSIETLAVSLGQDVWTSYVRTEPMFMIEKKPWWRVW